MELAEYLTSRAVLTCCCEPSHTTPRCDAQFLHCLTLQLDLRDIGRFRLTKSRWCVMPTVLL
eukprot:4149850-Amphidinium_carterae.1